jgi:probable HAF family extracellular repeat protein
VIVGQSYNPNATSYEIPFIDTGGGLVALPLLTGNATGNANAINSMGVAVGVSGSQAVSWTGGSVQGLGFLPATGITPNSVAFGINDAGQIVGVSDVGFAAPHAFIYQDGTMTDLNRLIAPGKSGGFTTLNYATAINNIGSITGYGLRPGHNAYFAFLAVPNIPTVIPPNPGVGAAVATEESVAPDLGGASGSLTGSLFSTLGPPAIDKAGDIAFHATIKAPPKTKAVPATENSGIWLYPSGGNPSLIAITGDANNPAPGTNGALFTKLGDPVLSSSGDLAFLGSFDGGMQKVKPSAGIFVTKSSVTTLAYAIGSTAPGFLTADNVQFTGFQELAINNGGGVAFLATIKGTGISGANDSGFWATNSVGALELVAQPPRA